MYMLSMLSTCNEYMYLERDILISMLRATHKQYGKSLFCYLLGKYAFPLYSISNIGLPILFGQKPVYACQNPDYN